MRARSAYISSLSTTAIIVASALLMLALLGAIVAFRGWPHGDGRAPIDAIGVTAQPARLVAAATVVVPAPPARPPTPPPTHATTVRTAATVSSSGAALVVPT